MVSKNASQTSKFAAGSVLTRRQWTLDLTDEMRKTQDWEFALSFLVLSLFDLLFKIALYKRVTASNLLTSLYSTAIALLAP